jgi:hypothetical protein
VKGGVFMLTLVFIVAMIWVSWKMLVLGIKAAWGLTKILCTVLLLPFFLIELVMVGMIYLAIPILIVVGLVAIIGGIMEA